MADADGGPEGDPAPSDTDAPGPDDSDDATPASDDAADRRSNAGPGGRDVTVPLRVYKTVTVFSTLFAVGAVVLGFVLLDRATRRATAPPEDVNVLLAVAGLGSIAIGAVVYAFSTRFRTEGMGNG